VSIAVNDGQVWGLNAAHQIYRWDSAKWAHISGTLTTIAVGSDGQVWGINSGQDIYQWNGIDWTHVAGALVSIAVNGGQVWGLNAANEIYRWDVSKLKFVTVPGKLSTIAVGSDGQVWGTNSSQGVYRLDEAGWTHVVGTLDTIAIGKGGPDPA
jgi:hypothetical protein